MHDFISLKINLNKKLQKWEEIKMYRKDAAFLEKKTSKTTKTRKN